jgi:hypothetical protein
MESLHMAHWDPGALPVMHRRETDVCVYSCENAGSGFGNHKEKPVR